MSETKSISCRLCNYQSDDLIDVFDIPENNVENKINKYLYLRVLRTDFSTKICWMCSNQLDTFHKFCNKINQIQENIFTDQYIAYVLPQYKSDEEINPVIEEENDENNRTTDEPLNNIAQNELSESIVTNNDNESPEYDVPGPADVQYSVEVEDLQETPIRPKRRSKKIESTPPPGTSLRQTRSKSSTVSKTKPLKNQNDTENLILNPNVKSSSSVDQNSFMSDETDTHLEGSDHESDSDSKSVNSKKRKSNNSLELSEKGRRRPRIVKNKSPKEPHSIGNEKGNIIEKSTKSRKVNKRSTRIISELSDECLEENYDEGESENEFPARDSDNDDWPAQETLNTFPEKILENGLLLVKGKKLMSMISKFYKLKCEICAKDNPSENQKTFKQLRQLLKHYSTDHNKEGYVQCCQTKLSRYPAIIMHMARHIQPDAFKCDICNYMVTRPRFLENHKQTHLPEDQKPFACDQCPRRFCWKGALQIHLISHQPAEKRKLYVCHVCGKDYDTPGGLSTHKKLIHSERRNGESHVCHVCAKNFATRTGLNEHMSTIHQPREKDQVQCLECGKWLMNNRCLKSHMVLHSNVEIECHLCSYATKKHILLKRHLLTQHSDAKPFVCDICSKSFKLKRALTVHLAQHKTQKTYKCPFCSRTFNSSTNFYTHRKNIHPVELQAMKAKDMEEQRLKRVRAGIEPDRLQEVTLITHTDLDAEGYRIIDTDETEALSDNQTTYIISENNEILKADSMGDQETIILDYN